MQRNKERKGGEKAKEEGEGVLGELVQGLLAKAGGASAGSLGYEPRFCFSILAFLFLSLAPAFIYCPLQYTDPDTHTRTQARTFSVSLNFTL